jgi:hypothetical protein
MNVAIDTLYRTVRLVCNKPREPVLKKFWKGFSTVLDFTFRFRIWRGISWAELHASTLDFEKDPSFHRETINGPLGSHLLQ